MSDSKNQKENSDLGVCSTEMKPVSVKEQINMYKNLFARTIPEYTTNKRDMVCPFEKVDLSKIQDYPPKVQALFLLNQSRIEKGSESEKLIALVLNAMIIQKRSISCYSKKILARLAGKRSISGQVYKEFSYDIESQNLVKRCCETISGKDNQPRAIQIIDPQILEVIAEFAGETVDELNARCEKEAFDFLGKNIVSFEVAEECILSEDEIAKMEAICPSYTIEDFCGEDLPKIKKHMHKLEACIHNQDSKGKIESAKKLRNAIFYSISSSRQPDAFIAEFCSFLGDEKFNLNPKYKEQVLGKIYQTLQDTLQFMHRTLPKTLAVEMENACVS